MMADRLQHEPNDLAARAQPASAVSAAALVSEAAATKTRARLSARGMTGISEYEPADLVISVGAGVTMPQIAAATAKHNQFLALDPAMPEETTIGEIVARNLAGPLRYGHGTPRDQVLGVEIVTGEGRILEFGGKVVKNVAGYDVTRLIVGSGGRLGLITRVNLRLKPLPAVDRTIVMPTGSLERAIEIVSAITDARLDPVALEIVSAPQWTLLARFHGNSEAVEDGIAHVRAAAGAGEVLDGNAAWGGLAADEAAAPYNVRLANLPSVLADTFAHAVSFAEQARFINTRYYAHAGNGIIRITADTTDTAVDTVARAAAAARDHIRAAGGSLKIDRLPGAPLLDDGASSVVAALTRKIVNVFDPAGIFG